MRILSLVILLIGTISFCGCDVTINTGTGGGPGVQGSGISKTEDREVGDFDSIELYGAGTVNVVYGEEVKLTITADDNLLELLGSEVVDGKLVIKPTESISAKSDLIFDVTVAGLQKIETDGAAKVNITDATGDDLVLEINGAGSAQGNGSITNLTVNVNGAGNVDLKELEAKNVKVSLAGASKATVFASEAVDAELAGLGSIVVHGNPADVQKEVNGLGTVKIVE